jgi:hypothetical protein
MRHGVAHVKKKSPGQNQTPVLGYGAQRRISQFALDPKARSRKALVEHSGRLSRTYQFRRPRAVQGAIGYDKTWRLFVNMRQEELRGSAGL